MKLCIKCQKIKDGICQVRHKIPPEKYAEKCRYYLEDPDFTLPELEPEKIKTKTCKTCKQYSSDQHGEWCLHLDHQEYKYNFRKIDSRNIECRS